MVASADAIRQFYAEELLAVCNLQSPALVRALAAVPRERFLGPGPWRIRGMDGMFMPGAPGTYRETPDADPRHLYHNVLVSIDPSRELNNGHPGTLASWIDLLRIREGERIVHIGSGPGYYTAILAEMTGGAGSVTAIEVDPALAARAVEALSAWPNVTVIAGDGVTERFEQADVILVNAGVTHPAPGWLDALAPNGRMLLPLTFEPAPGVAGKGCMILITRSGDAFTARAVSMVQVYSCVGGRDPQLNAALMQTFSRGGWEKVRSLRRDAHDAGDRCWFHASSFCLSFD
ncbi:MAG TPA: rRNA adenine N-6-methyltransferase family protein [Vicinamibacterales bacterium]|jgi:protein-L-isoaspartate(D-aspartate) O-methyltransferase|nr:rRNA adenine N-6-methyltransferase family protein [Vicinamibacterales bacterium]